MQLIWYSKKNSKNGFRIELNFRIYKYCKSNRYELNRL